MAHETLPFLFLNEECFVLCSVVVCFVCVVRLSKRLSLIVNVVFTATFTHNVIDLVDVYIHKLRSYGQVMRLNKSKFLLCFIFSIVAINQLLHVFISNLTLQSMRHTG